MRRTHKIIGLILVLVLCMSFALAGCQNENDPGTTAAPKPSATNPTDLKPSQPTQPGEELKITVLPQTVEIYAGDEFKLLMGVTVNNEEASLYVSGDEGFDVEVPGTYTITYTAELGDKKVTATRTITVGARSALRPVTSLPDPELWFETLLARKTKLSHR